MVDASLLQKTAKLRLRQRLVVDRGGSLFYRFRDGGLVAISREEWLALANGYEEEVAPASRRLRWAFNLSVPFAIAMIGLLAHSGPIERSINLLPSLAQMVIMLAIVAGMPFTFLFLHYRTVRRATEGLDSTLRPRPRVQAEVAPRPAGLDTLEILGLVLVGPTLVLQMAGSLVPGIFRNTPLAAMRIDAVGIAGFAVIAALLIVRRRAAR